MTVTSQNAVSTEMLLDGRIARLTLDTGRRGNILSFEDLEAFYAALRVIAEARPRVLVIASGCEDLSRGVQLDVLQGGPAQFEQFVSLEFAIWQFVECLPFITIAGLRGYAVGNAAELALACDFRVGCSDMKLLYPEIKVGFSGPIERLCAYVGIGRAKEILLRASVIDAGQATQFGLVTDVFEPDIFDASLMNFAREFAEHPPIAVARTKQSIAQAYHRPQGRSDTDRLATLATYQTGDREEGIAALQDRRLPKFSGR